MTVMTVHSQHSACSCGEASRPHTLLNLSYFNNNDTVKLWRLTLFYCIVYPPFNLPVCSFWLIVVICEHTCVFIWGFLSMYNLEPLYLTTWHAKVFDCFVIEAFYCIFCLFLTDVCFTLPPPSFLCIHNMGCQKFRILEPFLHAFLNFFHMKF